ncbi:chromatin modification-related protein EAF6 [Coniochaeta pulveracea]|uniref:Chromatin modification-related protein EAF6 n=1 Tax=Coniochaeta pulveracea TaxID=177199 RepID=A0A420Y385_9PEZI|nr:chromatin modification-related protein EAF6 [Coniochaeta pulveracea]
MTESQAPNGGVPNPGAAGIPFYEKTRQELKSLIARKKLLEKKLAAEEELIYEKETEYLENTPSGNIIIGFDNYTKGTTGAAAQRRKTGLTDANRVFSRSSISYNPNAEVPTPAASTPASHAPTPVSTSYAHKDKGDSSAAPTPTSTTASKAGKKKGKAGSARPVPEDSETDARETKKTRINFGAGRK